MLQTQMINASNALMGYTNGVRGATDDSGCTSSLCILFNTVGKMTHKCRLSLESEFRYKKFQDGIVPSKHE